MKFAYDFSTFPYFLFAAGGIALVIAFALVLVGSSALRLRAERLFGETSLVETLFTFNATSRRAFKGVLLVLAMLFSFIALSRPQYGKGTRVIPATNLDVVVVLDEAYNEYIPAAERIDTATWLKDFPNLLICRTFSKIYGLAGLRVGYALASAEIADLMRAVLEGAGFDVATAESGAVALELLAEARFDAIVSDVRMPDIDGAALWRAVREQHPALAFARPSHSAASDIVRRCRSSSSRTRTR